LTDIRIDDPEASREAEKYTNPIASRELILQVLSEAGTPLYRDQLAERLGISGEEPEEALRRRLRAMERDGQLLRNRKGAYGPIDKMDLLRGRVIGHRDGFGFAAVEQGDDLFLAHRQMRKVFEGDEVLVRVAGIDERGRREGAIVEVLARNTEQLVGRLIAGTSPRLKPDNPRIVPSILLDPTCLAGASDGQWVLAAITQPPDREGVAFAKVVEVLGDHLAPGMEIDVALRSHQIPHRWPDAVETLARALPLTVEDADKQGRIDLRELPLVTIDGEDARDFDDAVFCTRKKTGGWRLYVAIADVAHYVTPESPLDHEAILRGNSVYFPSSVIPMLPHALSNGLCSLNPQVDRLCMVCEITVSNTGKLSGFQFYEAVMHSQARLTYTQVAAMLDASATDAATLALRTQYAPLVPHLRELHALYAALRSQRELRGAIDFETVETRVVFDAQRKIERIVPVHRNDAHKIIEECMLAANVCAARLFEKLEVPALFRVHEPPKAQKLENLITFMTAQGLVVKTNAKGSLGTQEYQALVEQLDGRPDAHILQTMLLRSMNQAVYQPTNLGHFGLAYKAYTHFTSPIRRYPDLLVHRALRSLLRGPVQSSHLKRADDSPQQDPKQHYPYQLSDLTQLGVSCSRTERRADEATRDVMNWLKCEFLQDRIGEVFEGVIASVTGFGLFVELNDLYVEGLVHISSLPEDYYHFEAAHQHLIGERHRQRFALGDKVRVQVMSVNLDDRKVDLQLIGREPRRRLKASPQGDQAPSTPAKTAKASTPKPAAKSQTLSTETPALPLAKQKTPKKSALKTPKKTAKKKSPSKTSSGSKTRKKR
jgi:ribonuclease R